MSNNQSLRDAVPKVMALLEKYHYSKNYTDVLRRHFYHVVDLYEGNGITNYKAGQYQLFYLILKKNVKITNYVWIYFGIIESVLTI